MTRIASYTRVWQHISLLLIIKSGIRDQPHKMEAKALALYSLSLSLTALNKSQKENQTNGYIKRIV